MCLYCSSGQREADSGTSLQDADIPDPLLALGPSIVEVGGITPWPQEGNAKPRGSSSLFRSITHFLLTRTSLPPSIPEFLDQSVRVE